MIPNRLLKLTLFLVLVLFTLSACGLRRAKPGQTVNIPKEEITLEYWRVFDEASVLDEFATAYNEKHPNITIVTKKIEIGQGETIQDYQRKLTKAIADGQGPDLFMIHNDWLPQQINQIAPAPANIIGADEFRKIFPVQAQVVQNDFLRDNRVYAVPYYIDALMLFYNTTLFDEAKVKRPPQTWNDLLELVPKFTKSDPQNRQRIIRSAIPLGVGVDHMARFADIVATLMLQSGANLVSPDRSKATFDLPTPGAPTRYPAKEALAFYTSFADPRKSNYTYTDATYASGSFVFPADVQAFVEQKAAMFIGYAYQVANIKRFTTPKVPFATAPLPQIDLDNPKVIADYWGETVSKTSQYPDVAWDFIRFMSTASNNRKYAQRTQRVPARYDLRENYLDHSTLGAVAKQIPYAQSWYRKDAAAVEKIFNDMVLKVLREGVDLQVATSTAAGAINALKD